MIAMILVLYGLSIVYAILSGIVSAYIYGKRGDDSLPLNEHKHFVYERIVIACIVLLSFWFGIRTPLNFATSTAIILLIIVAGGLSYSFFHDGLYYIYMNKILEKKIFPKGFKSFSGNSTAIHSFKWTKRLMMLKIAIGILIVLVILVIVINNFKLDIFM